MGKDLSQGRRDALGTHLKRFSAPARIRISLLICWLIRARRCCSLLRWVWAKGSQPCWEKGRGSHHGIVAAVPIPPPSPDVPQHGPRSPSPALPHAEALGWGQMVFDGKKSKSDLICIIATPGDRQQSHSKNILLSNKTCCLQRIFLLP